MLVVIAVVVGGAIAADKMMGAVADQRQNAARQQMADLKQVGNMIKTDGTFDPNTLSPKTEIGKSLKGTFAQIKDRRAKLDADLKACYIDNPLDWPTISKPEGRKAALQWVKAEKEAFDSYNRDVLKIRQDIVKVTGTGKGSEVARKAEKKLNDTRDEMYRAFKSYIEAVGRCQLVTKEGETYFVKESDRQKCDALLKDCAAKQQAFDIASEKLVELRAKELSRVKNRMAAYSF